MFPGNFHIDIVIIYFVYGLAFFTMGIALTLEAMRSPILAERRVLRPLAAFGLLHGAHEWIEIILLQGIWLGAPFPQAWIWIRSAWLVVSFIPLVVFGVLILSGRPLGNLWSVILSVGCLLAYLLVFYFASSRAQGVFDLDRADPIARYVLAFPGGILAGFGLEQRAREVHREGRLVLARRFRWAALGMGLYGITQIFVSSVDLFPAQYINAALFLEMFGLPIQLVRGILAGLVTVSLIRAIQIVELQRDEQLSAAQRDRLEALEQIHRELQERAILRRELWRHTVIAQEDERARIARELHDETAQFLTALSLNLATLRSSFPEKRETNELIERLQSVLRQMSGGIYRLIRDLRPAQLDDLGLVAALQSLADDEYRRTGLRVTLQVTGSNQRMDPLLETVIFRVAQEAINNVARHAGCDQATIGLSFEDGGVILKVIDQGIGIRESKALSAGRGWGLEGMRERAESIGGQFELVSPPEGGTVVIVTIPIRSASHGAAQEVSHELHSVDAG
jgi:signal transduction histidine kinase